jgi:hypothetical protein
MDEATESLTWPAFVVYIVSGVSRAPDLTEVRNRPGVGWDWVEDAGSPLQHSFKSAQSPNNQ